LAVQEGRPGATSEFRITRVHDRSGPVGQSSGGGRRLLNLNRCVRIKRLAGAQEVDGK